MNYEAYLSSLALFIATLSLLLSLAILVTWSEHIKEQPPRPSSKKGSSCPVVGKNSLWNATKRDYFLAKLSFFPPENVSR